MFEKPFERRSERSAANLSENQNVRIGIQVSETVRESVHKYVRKGIQVSETVRKSVHKYVQKDEIKMFSDFLKWTSYWTDRCDTVRYLAQRPDHFCITFVDRWLTVAKRRRVSKARA